MGTEKIIINMIAIGEGWFTRTPASFSPYFY
jgi:hypothetical protein